MRDKLTVEQARELAMFHKSARANQPHLRPSGRIITDPEEIAKRTPPWLLSEVVIRIDRSQPNGDEQQDN